MIYVAWIAGAIVLLVTVMYLTGALLPKNHVASVRGHIDGSLEDVFATLREPARFSEWRLDVKSVEVLPDESGRKRWIEKSSDGDLALEEAESCAPGHLVTRIADPDLPFGGTWTFELSPEKGGTALTITERGEVRPPLFRFMSKFIFGHESTMKKYIAALTRKFAKGD
ncbi:MAG: SRPBCC family protein [Planctomycetes bacterium]|nr:SRPBCC family protein [Planctomycetota bacterium]